jgi:hypothetical protein
VSEADLQERSAGLFEPDSLLPTQYFDRIRRRTDLTGEQRLMFAIIEDAVDVYLRHSAATRPHFRELFARAERWIESDDSFWVLSFPDVCDHLGLDSRSLRRGLRACKRRARGGPEAACPARAVADFPGRRWASNE